MKKRFLSMLLAFAMVLTIAPISASAEALDPEISPDQLALETHTLGPAEQSDSESEGIVYYRFEADEFPATMSVGLDTSKEFTGTTYYEQLDDASKAVYDVLKGSFSSEATTSVSFSGTAAAAHLVSGTISYIHTKVSDAKYTYDQIEATDDTYVTSSGALDEWLYPLVASAYLALTNDHPEMPWVRAASYGWGYSVSAQPKDTTTATIVGKDEKNYTYTTERYENVVVTVTSFTLNNPPATPKTIFDTAVDTAVTAVNTVLDIQNIAESSGKTRYEIVKAIHDHVCNLITYDKNTQSPLNQTAYSGLVDPHKTVCAGYAKSFKVLCDKYDIPCVLVSGRSKNSSGSFENHEWNYVKMDDGFWYGVDCTWDDQSTIYYDYLLSGSKTVATHFNSDAFDVSHVADGMWVSNVTFAYPKLSETVYTQKTALTGTVKITLDVQEPSHAVEVGKTLAVGYSEDFPSDASYTYQWYRNNEIIDDATTDEYTTTSDDEGAVLTVKVTGTGEYSGTLTSTNSVKVKKPLTPLMIKAISGGPFVYTGEELNSKPTVTVQDDDKPLIEGTDYTVTFHNIANPSDDKPEVTNWDAGKVYVAIHANEESDYSGKYVVGQGQNGYFEIQEADVTYTYTATAVTVGDNYPGETAVTATGVTKSDGTTEPVSGTLTWYTDSGCTASASGTFKQAGPETLWWKFTPNATDTNGKNYNPLTDSASFTVSDKAKLAASVAIQGTPINGVEVSAQFTDKKSDAGTLKYEWYLNNELIDGATTEKYTVQPADVGSSLKVKVSDTSDKYASVESESVTAEGISVKVVLTLNPTEIKVGQTATPSVTVTTTNGANPNQIVTGGTLTYSSDQTGVAVIDGSTVKGIAEGTANIKAHFELTGYKSADSDAVAISISEKDRLNVTISDVTVAVGQTSSAFSPVVKTKDNATTLTSDDYTVEYVLEDASSNKVTLSGSTATGVNVGTAIVAATVTPKGAYADTYGTTQKKFAVTVEPKAVTPTVEVTGTYTYNGNEQKPVPTVTADSKTLTVGTDYEVTYSNNINAGTTAKVIVTAKAGGNYSWSPAVEKEFIIDAAKLASAHDVEESVRFNDIAEKIFSATAFGIDNGVAGVFALKTNAAITGSEKLDSGYPQYGNNVKIKLGSLTVEGVGNIVVPLTFTPDSNNYQPVDVTLTINVTPKTPVDIMVTPAASLTYDGTAKPVTVTGVPDGVTVTVTYTGTTGTTYEPSAEAPKNAGHYNVTAMIPADNADYTGSKTVAFEIAPKQITVSAKTITAPVGDALPSPLYDVEGLVAGETLDPVPVVDCGADMNVAGDYEITVNGPAASTDGNYSITYRNPGKLTVAKQTAATPTATPENRTFTGSVDVTLNCTTPGAKIYYVTDTAKDPAIEGTEFTRAITLTETTTIKAIAKADGMNNSEPLEVTYTKQTPIQPPVVQQVATPVINPAGGGFYGSQQVTITCATPGATIYYSVDGAASQPYVGSFTLYNSATVTAYATFSGMTDSNPATAAFTRYTYTPDPTPDPDPDPEPDNNYEPPVSSNNNNSNNSSNSSNSSTTQPTTPTQPETPTVPEVTARPEATVDGGTASAAVPAETVEKLVEQAVSGKSDTLVIAPVIGGDVTKAEVTLPANAVTAIANATSASLRVETPVAEVTIPSDSLAGLGNQGAEIAVTAEKSEDGGVDVAVVVDGQRVENVPIKAAIPTPCGPGTVAKIVDANGNVISTVRKSSASGDGQTMNVPLDGSAKVVFVDSGKSFPDVPATNWAADAVAFASSHELMNGVNEETFSPSTPMTRGMLAVVLHNLEGNPGASYQGGFSDVTGSAWYAEAVQWASEKKVVTGLSDGVFAPDSPITREQLVVMLYRYMGEPAVSGSSLGRFSDSGTVSDWAAQAMSWAVANGVVNGSNGALNPQGSATRAEVAQMLMNFVSSGML